MTGCVDDDGSSSAMPVNITQSQMKSHCVLKSLSPPVEAAKKIRTELHINVIIRENRI